MTTPRTILFSHSASVVGGGNKVLLTILERIDRTRFAPVSVIPEAGPIEHDLAKLDVPYFFFDVRPNGRSRLSSMSQVARLAAKLKVRRIACTHANDPFTYRAVSLAARLLQIPRICHVHHPGRSLDSLPWCFRTPPHWVITPSNHVRDSVQLKLGTNVPCPIETLYNPIDTDWFRPATNVIEVRQRLALSVQKKHVSIIGEIAPHKGHDIFLRVARRILEQGVDAEFHIIGRDRSEGGKLTAALREQLRGLEIENRVRWWGFTSDETTRDLMQASDLFFMPTREEGFGLVVAEAQACEIPVIASKIAPLDEVLCDGKGGRLIPLHDEEAFARNACELLASSNLRAAYGSAGRQWVSHMFSHNPYVARLMEIYEILCDGQAVKRDTAPAPL